MFTSFNGASVPEGLVQDFYESACFHSEEEFRGKPHLADFFYGWLLYNKGARQCGNSQAIALSVLMLSWADLQRQPDSWLQFLFDDDATEPSLTLIDAECTLCQAVLDPQFFQLLVADPDWAERRTI